MENNLEEIIWGSRLFVNAQLLYRLLSVIKGYYAGTSTLTDLFQLIQEIHDQQKVRLYKELNIELEEFIAFEKIQKDTPQEPSVIKYTIDRLVANILEGRIRNI